MKKHLYQVTLEHLVDNKGEASTYDTPLNFEIRNHDDIFRIVELMKGRGDFQEQDATAFAVGLKMFSEIMIENKNHPLFLEFRPHFINFMKELKKGVQPS